MVVVEVRVLVLAHLYFGQLGLRGRAKLQVKIRLRFETKFSTTAGPRATAPALRVDDPCKAHFQADSRVQAKRGARRRHRQIPTASFKFCARRPASH